MPYTPKKATSGKPTGTSYKKPAYSPKVGKPAFKSKEVEPSFEIGYSMFLSGLIGLPYRTLALPIVDAEGNDSTIKKSIVKTLKDFTVEELFDLDNEGELNSFKYQLGRVGKSIENMQPSVWKESLEIFYDSFSNVFE